MKSWQILFKQAPKNDDGGQGGSTADDDFDDAADEALVEEGEAELEEDEGNDEDADPEEEEEQSDEDQDPDAEEEEEEEEEVEEEETDKPSGFRFKDPKTGDFDFKRINKAVGGPELEKAFKEQTATITRTSQENSRLKTELASPRLKEMTQKGAFLDRMMVENPEVKKAVLQVLHGGGAGQGQGSSTEQDLFNGFDPNDPALQVLKQVVAKVQNFENQHSESRRQQQQREFESKFESGLISAAQSFKELIGRPATNDELELIAKEMEETQILNGERFVPSLFLEEIRKAERQRIIKARKVKRNLPKAPSGRRIVPTKGKRSREEEQDALWQKHIEEGGDDE